MPCRSSCGPKRSRRRGSRYVSTVKLSPCNALNLPETKKVLAQFFTNGTRSSAQHIVILNERILFPIKKKHTDR